MASGLPRRGTCECNVEDYETKRRDKYEHDYHERRNAVVLHSINKQGAKISEGLRESFWVQCSMAGFPASYLGIKSWSETDFTDDLKKFDVRTLILHGDDDQVVPIADTAILSAKLIKTQS